MDWELYDGADSEYACGGIFDADDYRNNEEEITD